MIQNPILFNDNLLMAGLIACCLIVLASVMIPKAIRHRKQMKQNESEDPVPDKGQEVIPSPQSESAYKEKFLRRNEIKTRECVYVSREIHSKVVKLVKALENTSITIGGYIDLVLSEHLEQNKEEINEIFRQSRRDLL
jgi:hypothetical protein